MPLSTLPLTFIELVLTITKSFLCCDCHFRPHQYIYKIGVSFGLVYITFITYFYFKDFLHCYILLWLLNADTQSYYIKVLPNCTSIIKWIKIDFMLASYMACSSKQITDMTYALVLAYSFMLIMFDVIKARN